MDTKVVLPIALALLAGCQSPPPPGRSLSYVKPGLVLVPAEQLQCYTGAEHTVAGEAPPPPLGAMDTQAVQIEAPVSALQWNRYADPGRPNELMHEAHIVYRREGGPRWRLQLSRAGQQILIGPQMTDGRGEVKALASQELEGFIQDGRANLRRQQEVMERLSDGMKQLAEQQQQLAAQVLALQSKQAEAHENESDAEEEDNDVKDSGLPSDRMRNEQTTTN